MEPGRSTTASKHIALSMPSGYCCRFVIICACLRPGPRCRAVTAMNPEMRLPSEATVSPGSMT